MSNKTTFSRVRQPKPEYRHTGERARTRLLRALAMAHRKVKDKNGNVTEEPMTEDSYLQEVVVQSLENPHLMKEVFARLSPAAKSLAPTVAINFPKDGSPVERMEAVLFAVVDGQISPDVGITISAMIKQTSDVNEATELQERMDKIEEMLRKQAAANSEGGA